MLKKQGDASRALYLCPMQKWISLGVFALTYPILWLIAHLPFRLLYLLSDGIAALLYHVIRLRRNTVQANIALALPQLSKAEQQRICKRFYHHLSDMFLEMIKTMHLKPDDMDKRFVFTNLDVYLDMEKQGKSIALMCAHYASYEWVISMNRKVNFRGYAIYKRIANPHFDALVKKIRSNFGATLITTKETAKTIEANALKGQLGLYGFASDQSPKWSKADHWYSFMGVTTPIHIGAEQLAKRYDMNVIFLKVKKVKRGYYEATFEHLSDHPQSEPDYAISERFMDKVAEQIYEAPEFYFWIHKRWKHRR